MKFWRDSVGGLDSHHRFFWAAGGAALAAVLAARALSPLMAGVATWNVFAGITIILSWFKMNLAEARTSVREASLQDSSRSAIFTFVILASVAAVISAGLLLGVVKGGDGSQKGLHVMMAVTTVLLSWTLIHTVFGIHYTHLFYQVEGSGKAAKDRGGLNFPEDEHPDFLDFAYFSFVIGMTCQVSDVEVTSKQIRRLALWHGLLSFAFNTVILAMTINLSASLVSS